MKGYWKAILVLGLCGALLALSHIRRVRWDLTDDRHYSLSEATKTLLKQTDAPIEVTLLLDGDLNAGFTRLKKATEELLEEMSVYSDLRTSKDLAVSKDSLGLRPIVIHEREQNGKTAQTTIYPYALISYKGRGAVVTLLKNTRGLSGEENLNNSIEQLEYAFAEALHRLQQTELPRIAIIEGHGEPDERYVWDLEQTLSQYFYVDRGAIVIPEQGVDVHLLDGYKAIIIANPQTAFSDIERFIIDQYIMRGGTVLWVVNGVRFSNDVLQSDGFTPIIPLDLGITDMLFRYGIRINPALVQDLQCLTIPVNVSDDPETPNLQPLPWTYAPLLLTSNSSPITRNTGQVMSTFVSPIDAVGGEDGIDKRILLATSTATRVTATPGEVNLNDLQPDLEAFRYQYVPVAVSLEGTFNSAFAHRMMPDSIISDEPIRKQSVATRQVVIGSGSIIMNEVERNQVLPMGYDRYNQIQFSNRDFIANVLLWLTDSEGLIQLREKTVALRLLNDKRAHDERARIQTISTISPIAILVLIGGVIWIIRKRKYASKKV
ncbi:MAG: gliding motility-associated ABC transporter substrate-binding protein GldG [Bacteroidales bacterium]|nr:gliding motility-associated ABC transporter substrate-binding protein GldG [Bacteroidales bacterium]MDY6406979.1 gliding motility-associated ABC transporter substrate-binding protein GldG [Bacteroidales bacterium]